VKTEILYGVHPVRESLRSNRRKFACLYIAGNKRVHRYDSITALADSLKIPIQAVSSSQLDSMTRTDIHQGVAARVSLYPWASLSEIVDPGESDRGNGQLKRFMLLLDHVVDPHNLGALIRTAHCFGVDGILIPKDRAAQPTAAVSKISAGALEHVRLVQITNLVSSIRTLKKLGLWVIGLDRTSRESIFSFSFPSAVAVVVGGEQKGLSALVKKNCDGLCSIPQVGMIDSLNASVAGAVAMYEIFRSNCADIFKNTGKGS